MAPDPSTEPGSAAVQPVAELPEPRPEPFPPKAASASRRVRARLARRMTAGRSTTNPVLEPLIAVHREIYPKADLAILQRAYEVAEAKHADQLRRSGDPYITHPLAVANILAELGMDTTTLVAALLHDTVEDWRLNQPAARLFWLTAAPGAGKSAFAAHLAHTRRGHVRGEGIRAIQAIGRGNE
jgi:GTP pyrophosphokinase